MKKWIHEIEASERNLITGVQINKIESVVLVDDVSILENYNPRDYAVYGATLNYNEMTTAQLLQLSPKEIEKISDIRTLRKLPKEVLSVPQQIRVAQDNAKNFENKISEVKNILAKLKDCHAFYISPTKKNGTFADELHKLGCVLRDEDAADIIDQLHVKDYSYSTLSYLDINWNALLMVFEYKGDHTFQPARKSNADPVTVTGMDIYIKIDVDNETENGYAAMSFHNPEFKLHHPYKDYPVNKE